MIAPPAGYEFKEVFESQGKDYGVHGAEPGKLFNLFNGIVIMSFAYGNTIIPEIQARARPTAETGFDDFQASDLTALQMWMAQSPNGGTML